MFVQLRAALMYRRFMRCFERIEVVTKVWNSARNGPLLMSVRTRVIISMPMLLMDAMHVRMSFS